MEGKMENLLTIAHVVLDDEEKNSFHVVDRTAAKRTKMRRCKACKTAVFHH